MARYGIYLKAEGFLIKSFGYICEGLVLVYRHFMKPQNVGGNLKKRLTTKNNQENEDISNCKVE